MALDPSIPLQGNINQGGSNSLSNALGPIMQIMQLKNLQNQQAQFQQQFAARQAIGPILQQSIDPQTGEPDYGKAAILASKDPQAAWMTGDLLNQGIQRKQTQALTMETNLKNQVAQTQQQAGLATSLLSQRTPFTKADGTQGFGLDPSLVQKTITDEMQSGQIPQDVGAKFLQNMPQDPEGLHNRVLQVAQNLNGHNDQLQSILGKIEPIDTGNKIIQQLQAPGAVNQLTQLGNPISKGVAPQVIGTDTGDKTQYNLFNPSASNPVTPLTSLSKGLAPQIIQQINPQTKENQNQLIGGEYGTNPNSQNLLGVNTPPPGAAEAEKDLKENFAPQVSNMAGNVNQQRLILSEISKQMADLPSSGQIDKVTGPGAKVKNLVASFLSASGASPERINNWQDINDYATLRSKMMDVVIPQAKLMFGSNGHGLPVGEYAPFAEAHLDPSMPTEAINGLVKYYSKVGGLAQLQSDMLGKYLDAAQDPSQRAAIHGNKYLSQNDFINGFSNYLKTPAGQSRLQQYGVIGGNQ